MLEGILTLNQAQIFTSDLCPLASSQPQKGKSCSSNRKYLYDLWSSKKIFCVERGQKQGTIAISWDSVKEVSSSVDCYYLSRKNFY